MPKSLEQRAAAIASQTSSRARPAGRMLGRLHLAAGAPPASLPACGLRERPASAAPPARTRAGAPRGPPRARHRPALGTAPRRAHWACAEPGDAPARRHGAHRGGGREPLRSLAVPAAAHAALPPGLTSRRSALPESRFTRRLNVGVGEGLGRDTSRNHSFLQKDFAEPRLFLCWDILGAPRVGASFLEVVFSILGRRRRID
ncbi:uridine diphosphate glucose pyrophosphatase NUDT14 isoform X3 [Odocoileus virginianus]|uniref:Uridine diphosphate glucose pyrophosphatase NUDT14 isoform X3 n=1 Tax=Odocoileus virginianus TaxID=9874 RepID=A0ABM4J162_ODOVR